MSAIPASTPASTSDSTPAATPAPVDRSASDRVFEVAADLFGLLAAPVRLRIVCQLCAGELNVGELGDRLASQPEAGVSPSNLSQHLNVLYRAGVLGRRRAGAQVFYRVASERVRLLCEAVCRPGRGDCEGAASPRTAGAPGSDAG